MTSKEVCARIEEVGIVAALRLESEEDAVFAAEALIGGDIPIIEIPLTVPGATRVISHLVKAYPHAVVGAGGVRRLSTAHQCLDAGALFLTSDGLHPAVVEFAAQEEIVGIPGALTPTEVMHAWEAHSRFVKVVPCAQIGGETYIGSLHRMYPHIPLIAAGGVSQKNASKFIFAGATALGIGRELLPIDAIRQRHAGRISNLAQRFLSYVKSGRGH